MYLGLNYSSVVSVDTPSRDTTYTFNIGIAIDVICYNVWPLVNADSKGCFVFKSNRHHRKET
jgi:hypothetical protein